MIGTFCPISRTARIDPPGTRFGWPRHTCFLADGKTAKLAWRKYPPVCSALGYGPAGRRPCITGRSADHGFWRCSVVFPLVRAGLLCWSARAAAARRGCAPAACCAAVPCLSRTQAQAAPSVTAGSASAAGLASGGSPSGRRARAVALLSAGSFPAQSADVRQVAVFLAFGVPLAAAAPGLPGRHRMRPAAACRGIPGRPAWSGETRARRPGPAGER